MRLALVRCSEIAGVIGLPVIIGCALVLGPYAEPVVFTLFPVFALVCIYLTSIRCAVCGNVIYTPAHVKLARAKRGAGFRLPMYAFRDCPECGAALTSSDAYRLGSGLPTPGANFGRSLLVVGGFGLFVIVAFALAHYMFNVPITLGKDFDSKPWP